MRREPDYFGDKDLDLIYVAKKLKEALRLEEFLTGAGVDYLVEPDKYSGGIIFGPSAWVRSSMWTRTIAVQRGRPCSGAGLCLMRRVRVSVPPLILTQRPSARSH